MTSIIEINNSDSEPLLSDNSSNSSDNSYCGICLEDFSKRSAYEFDCGHHLHVECFHKYFYYNYDVEKNLISCPICRADINLHIQQNITNKNKLCMKIVCLLSMTSLSVLSVFSLSNYLDSQH